MATKQIAWFVSVLFICGILFGVYRAGVTAGSDAQKAVLASWKRQVVEQAAKRREEQLARYQALESRFTELQNRPEQVKEVIRRVVVKADAKCPSLPANWRVLWNANTSDDVPKAATAPTVDDATRVDVAAAAKAVAEARDRFETNAAQLEGLQAYVRSVVGPFSESQK